jgi:hypothetical protein
MNQEEQPEFERAAFREFALACRLERDRIASASLVEQDRRFESSLADRTVAEFFAARLIAAVAR